MNKRTLSASLLTAGLSVGLAAATMSPALAQGTEVGGSGNTYFLQGNGVNSGQAAVTVVFGNADDDVYFGDVNGTGDDLPLVRRGNVYYVPVGFSGATQTAFTYGNPNDEVYLGDWDGDGTDTLAVRRGNLFLVKDDNASTGPADFSFRYGDAGDIVHVGNFNGTAGTPGVDNNGDGDFDDAEILPVDADVAPVVGDVAPVAADVAPVLADVAPTIADVAPIAADVAPVADNPATPLVDETVIGIDNNGDGDFDDLVGVPGVDNNGDGDFVDLAVPGVDNNGDGDFDDLVGVPGVDNNGDGDFLDAGVVGVDNNGDGDFLDPAVIGVPGDIAPVAGDATDTIMVQRGNEFFVSNDLNNATGVADYSFFFGDPGDQILVGDWATRARPGTVENPGGTAAASGNGADQLMVVRGNVFFQSTEISDADTNNRNPETFDVFRYGNVGDTAFTTSTPVNGIQGDSLGVRR